MGLGRAGRGQQAEHEGEQQDERSKGLTGGGPGSSTAGSGLGGRYGSSSVRRRWEGKWERSQEYGIDGCQFQ
ncbi:hypothetical protein Ani05nite_74790 [Amorphoplanes nipponensis]|uniref:Uncharacterized protein n=1 Tax=Actinoplanes nipponensis TaxID=135950 RepID=A0A919MY04_9ACTN|nr:hypothetical protein Ani05nite_74790 [Actinoplanes nipponensis]